MGDRDSREWHDTSLYSLSKLIYVISSAVVVYSYLCGYAAKVILGPARIHDTEKWIAFGRYASPFLIVLYVVMMLVVLSVFRPVSSTFNWQPRIKGERNPFFGKALLGIAGGVVGALATSPLPPPQRGTGLGSVALQFADAISPGNAYILVFPILALLIIVLAVFTELFFRGVVFRILAEHTTIPSAVIASCLLFAYIWPVFGPAMGVVLGIISAILYYRTRNLLSSIVADAVFMLLGGASSLLFHKFL